MAKEKEEGTAVDLQTRIEVTATDKHPFASKGEKFSIHPSVAKELTAKGYLEK